MSLENLVNRLESLDLDRVANAALQGQEDFIINLNTQDQLFEKGINSDGISLEEIGGEYSPVTVQIKTEKGQPVDRITLKDTGEFYDTWVVRLGSKEFEIAANPLKDETNLFDEWGEEIVGLTDESLDKLINEILPKIQAEIKRSLF